MGLNMNIAKTKVVVVDNTPINVNNVLIENVQGYVRELRTWENTTASRKRTRTKRYNEESRQDGRHTPTPGYLQKQPCHLPGETGVQLLCVASNGIVQRPDSDQPSTEQTCGRTDQNGKKYAQHHIQR